MVIVKNLSLTLNGKQLLSGVTCNLLPGRITSFIGKSGAGKTTLLKTIAGLMQPTDGTITIDSKQLSLCTQQERALQIGFVFQDFNLFGNLTVLENCIDPLLVQGMKKNEALERAHALLAQFELNEHKDKYPSALSGGQQQRVAIVRALCLNPKVLLLDEPTASLDPENSALLDTLLKKLTAQGITIGLSSQDMCFVRSVFDCVYFVEEGNIIEYCSTKESVDECTKIKQFIA